MKGKPHQVPMTAPSEQKVMAVHFGTWTTMHVVNEYLDMHTLAHTHMHTCNHTSTHTKDSP